jgi:hypothetical protein
VAGTGISCISCVNRELSFNGIKTGKNAYIVPCLSENII